jgi:hypothetical protein
MGGLFILGGFDSLAAKLLSFVAGVGLIAPLSLVRDKLYVAASRVALSFSISRKKLTLTRTLERFCSLSSMRDYWWGFGSLITRTQDLFFFEVVRVWFMGRIYSQALRWYMLFIGMIQ